MDLYLRISNELYLKRLIVGGLERVYEFSRDFRNEGMDRTHNPEFTMLEYYQAFADMHEMMGFTESLVRDSVEAAAGSAALQFQGTAIDFGAPWQKISMPEAVSARLGEDVRKLSADALRKLAHARHIEVAAGETWGVVLDALFSGLVQPGLHAPTFVIDYPLETSPLARVSRKDPGVVERFELFVAGMEIANAFSEQNDPEAQSKAFELQ